MRLAGAPARAIVAALDSPDVALTPTEFPGVKPRLLVKEGDVVRRGSAVLEDKARPGLKFVAPAAGAVRSVLYGPRRAIERVVIAPAQRDEIESLDRTPAAAIVSAARERVLEALLRSGYLALFRQRPFSRVPDPASPPRSIFVKGMATAPVKSDVHLVVRGVEAAFQAGLDALTRLTSGQVHLCLDADATGPSSAVTGALRVNIHYFRGPHPAGTTSVHIHHIDPIRPGDVVWTIRAVDVIRIGRLLLDGAVPPDQVVALGGPGVRLDERRYYRVRSGGRLSTLLQGRLYSGEQRVIAGDALGGEAIAPDGYVRLGQSALTVLSEDRERHFMGWAMPGLNAFSHANLFVSRLLRPLRRWDHGTNRHGSERAMVVCPSNMDLCGIIRAGLAEVESEGL